MMRYLFQTPRGYFIRFSRHTYVYLIVFMLGSWGIIPLQAKSTNKGSSATIDHSQEAAAVKASSTKKPNKRKIAKQDTFTKEQTGELFRSVEQLCVSAGLVLGLHQFSNKPFELSTLVAPLIGNLATDPLKAIGRSCAMLFLPILSNPKL